MAKKMNLILLKEILEKRELLLKEILERKELDNGIKNIYSEVKNLRVNKNKTKAKYTLILGNNMKGERNVYRRETIINKKWLG